jgi:hypothetical protein
MGDSQEISRAAFLLDRAGLIDVRKGPVGLIKAG